MQNLAGAPVSGTVSNLFLVHQGRLLTPSVASGCRPGLVRAAVLALAGQAGLPVEARTIAQHELVSATEVFFTNSLMEILPVAQLDGRALAGRHGPVTSALTEAFHALVAAETGV